MQEEIDQILLYIQNSQTDEAKQKFEALLKKLEKGKDIQAITDAGYQFQSLGFIDLAEQIYDTGRHLFPDNPRWPVLYGELKIDDGKYEEGLDELLQVNEENPYYLNALLLQADAYQALSMPTVSFVKLEEAKQIAPDEPIIDYGIAELYYSVGQFKQALPYYRDLLNRDDLDENVRETVKEHYNYALGASGNYESAIDNMDSQSWKDQGVNDQEQLAFYYFQTENYDKANTILASLHESQLLSENMLIVYAQVKLKLNDRDSALELLNQAVQANPYASLPYECRGRFFYEEGRLDQALSDFKQALEVDPDNMSSAIEILRIYTEQEDWDTALEVVRKLDQENFASDEFYCLAARVYNEVEDYDKAGEYFELAYPGREEDEGFLLAYLQFQRDEGNWSRIQEVFESHPGLKSKAAFLSLYQDLMQFQEEQNQLGLEGEK